MKVLNCYCYQSLILLLVFISFTACVFQVREPMKIPKKTCSEKGVCFEQVSTYKDVSFWVENKTNSDIVFTMDFRLNRMKSKERSPYTMQIPARQRTKFLKFSSSTVIDEARYQFTYGWQWGNPESRHNEMAVYRLPYHIDSSYTVSQGYNGKHTHQGESKYATDWNMPVGTPVLAAREGTVISVKHIHEESGTEKDYLPQANYVTIMHDDGTMGMYAHLQKDGIKVFVGQKVAAGELIGLSGNTGYSTGPHLHFVVFTPVNGFKYKSHPIKFFTEDGVMRGLEEGKSYKAVWIN